MPTRELQRPDTRPPRTPAPAAAPTAPEAPRISGFYRLVGTPVSYSLMIARLALGGVMFAHASQKVFGWFGGQGWNGTIQAFNQHLGIPRGLAAAAILAEFLGSIGLILGLFGRLAAIGVIAVMLGAIGYVHSKVGFFMNWSGSGAGEGWEYHVLAIALALTIVGWGSGAASVDRALEVRRPRETP